MTLYEIITKCNNAIGAPGAECVDFLAPLVVMNAHYELFHDWIERSKGAQLLAHYAREWEKAYKHFNTTYFRHIPEEVGVELVEEVFDDFVVTMHNGITRMRLAVMEQVQTDDLELKQRFASAYLCYELAIVAQVMFGRVVYQEHPARFVPDYDEITGETKVAKLPGFRAPAKSKDLQACEVNARKWFTEFIRINAVPRVLRSDKVVKEEEALARACVRWVKKMDEQLVGHAIKVEG